MRRIKSSYISTHNKEIICWPLRRRFCLQRKFRCGLLDISYDSCALSKNTSFCLYILLIISSSKLDLQYLNYTLFWNCKSYHIVLLIIVYFISGGKRNVERKFCTNFYLKQKWEWLINSINLLKYWKMFFYYLFV